MIQTTHGFEESDSPCLGGVFKMYIYFFEGHNVRNFVEQPGFHKELILANMPKAHQFHWLIRLITQKLPGRKKWEITLHHSLKIFTSFIEFLEVMFLL